MQKKITLRNSKIKVVLIFFIIIISVIPIILFMAYSYNTYMQQHVSLIKIYSNDDWENLANSKSWCNGSGTMEDPYIIENISIDAQQEWVDCVYISNTDVHFIIKNCTFYDSAYCYPSWCLCGIRHGMRLINITNGKILSNHIYLNVYGIRLESCNNILIIDNYIHNNNINLGLQKSNNNTISNNIISNYYKGSYGGSGLILEDSSNNRITNNNFNASGIIFYDTSPDISFSNSIDRTNLINGKPIHFFSHHNKLKSENFTNPGQIMLYNCSNITIKAFNFSNIAYPVYLANCSHFEISNNNFNNYSKRIFLEDCKYGSIINNTASNNTGFLIINKSWKLIFLIIL